MDEKTKRDLELHVAGATIRHKNPFEALESHQNVEKIDPEFIKKWVRPFYFELNREDDEWIEMMAKLLPEISDEVILKNLGDFNWRTRQTGSFFASLKNEKEFTEIIGTHLLKSEVCYAGREYAVTLSFFNTKESLDYLHQYLDYYLLHPELPFDQSDVISAVKYLDEINHTNHVSKHMKDWQTYIESQRETRNKQRQAYIQSGMITEKDLQKISETFGGDDIDDYIDTDFIKSRIHSIHEILKKSKS